MILSSLSRSVFVCLLATLAFTAQAQVGRDWRLRTPLPWGDHLTDVVKTDTRLIAVGKGMAVMQSFDDGTTWSVRQANKDATFYNDASIAWNGLSGAASKLLMTSDRGLWTSTRGDAWEAQSTNLGSYDRILLVIWTGTQWAGVQADYGENDWGARLITSPDGRTWTPEGRVPEVTANTQIKIRRMVYTGARYVLAGEQVNHSSYSRSGLIVSTVDGTNWSTTLLDGEDDADSIGGLIMDGSAVVGVGIGNGYGRCYTSPDGLAFTRHDIDNSADQIVKTPTRLVAMATLSGGSVSTSTDGGVTWTAVSGAPPELAPNGLCWSGTRVVSVGYSGTIFTGDGTGATWTQRTPTGPLSDWLGVAVNPAGVLVATNYQGRVQRSTDGGETWTQVTDETFPELNELTWDGSKFVAVNGSVCATSSADGSTWTSDIVFTDQYMRAVASYGGMLVAVGEETTFNSGSIFTSTDGGATWTAAKLPSLPLFSYLDTVARLGSVWVAGGGGSTLLTSTNGTTWTKRAIGHYMDFSALATNGSLMIAVSPYSGGIYYTSINGSAWTGRSFPEGVGAGTLVWTGTNFVATSGDDRQAMISTNGLNWTAHPLGTGQSINGSVWDASRSQVVAVATGGVVISSDATPVAEFVVASQMKSEGGVDSVPVQVTLSYPTPSGGLTIPIAHAGTAAFNTDYGVPTSVVFAAGEMTKTLNIAIVNDADVESDETVQLTLGRAAGMRLGTQATHTFTILDDDAPPTIRFTDTQVTLQEHAGMVSGRLELSWPAPSAITVPIVVAGTADGGDFIGMPASVSFSLGESVKFFAFNVTDDGDEEGDETVTLTLSTPTGATLGAETVFTATIQDNDPVGAPARHWTLQQQMPVADELTSIASNGTRQVIVGDGGLAMTSDDQGATWTRRSTGTRAFFNRVVEVSTSFIAVGDDGHVMTSPDGIQWADSVIPGAEAVSFTGASTNGSVTLIVGQLGESELPVAYYSYDLVHWQQVVLPAKAIGAAQAVVWHQNQFVLVGGGTTLDQTTLNYQAASLVLTSSDGIVWTDRSAAVSPGTYLENVIAAGDNLIAFSVSNKCFTSTNGEVWTQRSMGAKAIFAGTSTGGNGVLGVGFATATTSNGAAWVQKASPTQAVLIDVVKAGSTFIAISAQGGIYTSTDGVAWTKRSAGSESYAPLASVAWSGNQFVAVGGYVATASPILTSPDGTTWTPRTNPTSAFLASVAWSGTQFCAVGYHGTILTSPNGIAWTKRNSGTTLNLKEVIWTGNQFVVVGGHNIEEEFASGPSGAIVLTSPNGTTWTRRTVPTGKPLEGIVFNGSLYVAVGRATGAGSSAGAEILTSPDAVTWTPRSSGILDHNLTSIAWDGTHFFATQDGYGIIQSADGIAWTSVTLPPLPPDLPNAALLAIAFLSNYGNIVAVGSYGVVLNSIDQGATWQLQQSEQQSGTLAGLCWNGSKLVTVGTNGSIQTSGAVALGTPAVNFDRINSSWTEASGTAQVLVRLSRASSVPVTVNFIYTPDTGLETTGANADITLPNGPLVFAPGEVAKFLSIPIKDDKVDEPLAQETLTLTFGTITNANPGTSVNSHPIYISDNDITPAIFNPSPNAMLAVGAPLTLSVAGNGSAPLTVQWKLNGKAILGATSLLYHVPAVTLAHGGTYTCTLTNPIGSANANFEIGVYDDRQFEVTITGTADVPLTSKAAGKLTFAWTRDTVTLLPGSLGHTFSADQKVVTLKKPVSSGAVYRCLIGFTADPGFTPVQADNFAVSVVSLLPNLSTLPATLTAGEVGVSYGVNIGNFNTGGPITTWSATGLPAGLTISAHNGLLSGYPTTPGTKNVVIKATNVKGSVSKSTAITITGLPAAIIGTSTGLIERHATVNSNLGSYLKLDVLSSGQFTGSYTTGIVKQPFNGQAHKLSATQVNGSTQFYAGGKTVTLAFNYEDTGANPFPGNGTLTVQTPGGGPSTSANLRFWRPRTTGLADYVGRYNYALALQPAQQGSAAIPQGTGFGSATIAATGAITFAGRTGDGSVITASDSLNNRDHAACYAGLYGGLGSFSVQPVFVLGSPLTDNLVQDTVFSPVLTATWSKRPDNTAAGARTYPAGWSPISLVLTGSKYNPPNTGDVVMGLSYFSGGINATLVFSEGNIGATAPSPTTRINITPAGTIGPLYIYENERKITLTITNKTGEFKSTFNMDDYTANGVLLKRPVIAYGQIVRTAVALDEFRGFGSFQLPQLPSPAISPLPAPITTPILSGKMQLVPDSQVP